MVGRAEVILYEQCLQKARPRDVLSPARLQPLHGSEHKIRQRIAAESRALKLVAGILQERVFQVRRIVHDVAAEGNLMFSAHPMGAVAEMKILPLEGSGLAGADAEISRDRHED